MHLYELTEAFRKIQEVMYANAAPGESPHDVDEEDRFLEVANEAMDSYGLDIKGKIDSICAILTEMDAAITLREIESKRLKESARLMQAQADRLRAYLMSNMPTSKVKTDHYNVSIRAKAKPAVVITDDVPPVFMRTVSKETPDKAKIREHLENGGQLHFAKLD